MQRRQSKAPLTFPSDASHKEMHEEQLSTQSMPDEWVFLISKHFLGH